MQGVVLAAGTGSRLQHMTRDIPKALVEVGGRPLVQRALAFARLVGCERFVVVVGAFADKVRPVVEQSGLEGLQVAYNPDFLKGNLYSLGAARPLIDGDFLLLNTDHVYRKGVAGRVREQCRELTAFCDSDRQLGADDMKVALDESGRLGRISKQLDDFSRGYVGMCFCPDAMRDTYFRAFDEVAADIGDAAVVEMVLARLAATGHPAAVGDISGIGWLEIDTPDEHRLAERTVVAEPEDFPALEAWS